MKGVFIPEITVEMLRSASLDTIEEFFSRILSNDNEVTIFDAELPRWIPCSERLPEKSTDVVLVTVIDERRTRDIYLMRCDEVETAYILKWVSAWMPLPEPYKEETK